MANDALTHNGTVLNFDDIMARLDFVFSDKRPIYIIEQELPEPGLLGTPRSATKPGELRVR